jgi:glycerol-3-phosphate acyltransferase PlsX
MSEPRPVIAVDAMGGDHGPSVVVPGALANLKADSPFTVALYGDESALRAAVSAAGGENLPVTIVPCTQDIEMGESPASAIRNKKDSPIVRAMVDQKAGQVQAVVSAGSTGAMVAASLIILGRAPGVDRPAIATVIPTVKGELVLLDAGANIQCSAEHLVSFARMGRIFSSAMFGLENPTVGQLNIGSEPKKGTELCVETYALLQAADLNFIGNIEGNDLMLGPCDVVVTDGYTGNITLKMVEGFARFMGALLKHPRITGSESAALRPVLGFLQKNFTYEVYGGAMLLGVNGISIISHGRSSALAITNAVRVAAEMIRNEVPAKLAAAHS